MHGAVLGGLQAPPSARRKVVLRSTSTTIRETEVGAWSRSRLRLFQGRKTKRRRPRDRRRCVTEIDLRFGKG